jgi:nuclease S1
MHRVPTNDGLADRPYFLPALLLCAICCGSSGPPVSQPSLATPAPRWDACGHRTVAAIAWAEINAATRKQIEDLLQADPRGREYLDTATWPDDIKGGVRNGRPKAPLDKPWHYVDIPYAGSEKEIATALGNDGKTADPAFEDSANVVTAIGYFTGYLTARKGTPVEKVDALSWLIHLVGDVHQPLHCVTVDKPLANYTPPQSGDRGGNGFLVDRPSMRLHAFWDDLFDEPTGLPEQEGRNNTPCNAKALADELVTKLGKTTPVEMLAKSEPAEWARESFAYRTFVYSPALAADATAASPMHVVTAKYEAQARAIAEERVFLAGMRLARLLDRIFAAH